jgi:hypothetical protein
MIRIREWLGNEPILKTIAFALLLPLAGANLFLIWDGIETLADPHGYLPGAAGILAFMGGVGLIVQLALMNAARHNPQVAGAIFLIIGAVLALPAAVIGMLGTGLGVLVVLSPLPGSAVLVYAAWHHRRAVAREQMAWRSAPPYGR